MKKILNGEVVDMTPEEITARELEIQNEIELAAAAKAVEDTKLAAKASGYQKLIDLGLTQAEATALTGYTPE